MIYPNVMVVLIPFLFDTNRQEEIPLTDLFSLPSYTYIHPKSGEYNLFPSWIGLASSSNEMHHLF